jgi:hypothetical protein
MPANSHLWRPVPPAAAPRQLKQALLPFLELIQAQCPIGLFCVRAFDPPTHQQTPIREPACKTTPYGGECLICLGAIEAADPHLALSGVERRIGLTGGPGYPAPILREADRTPVVRNGPLFSASHSFDDRRPFTRCTQLHVGRKMPSRSVISCACRPAGMPHKPEVLQPRTVEYLCPSPSGDQEGCAQQHPLVSCLKAGAGVGLGASVAAAG